MAKIPRFFVLIAAIFTAFFLTVHAYAVNSTIIEDALGYLARAEYTRWNAVVFRLYGQAAKSPRPNKLIDRIAQSKGSYTLATDLERDIIALTASGIDARGVAGVDLIEKLSQFENIGAQGANSLIYALLAFDCAGYEPDQSSRNTRASIVAELLSFQNADGSFSLTSSSQPDVDITALAATALCPYDKAAAQKALDWAFAQQLDGGGFESYGVENCESACMAAIAASACGQARPELAEVILAYRNADGGFSHTLGAKSDPIATTQALMALYSIDTGKSPFVFFGSPDALEPGKTALSRAADVIGRAAVLLGVVVMVVIIVKEVIKRCAKQS